MLYEPQTVVERELTFRLASLLWRLRRASLIERLLQTHCKPPSDRNDRSSSRKPDTQLFHNAIRLLEQHTSHSPHNHLNQKQRERNENGSGQENGGDAVTGSARSCANKTRITSSFLQLAELPSAPFERINRYETALWRQFVQTLFALDEAKRHQLIASRHRFRPYPPQW